MEQTTGTVPEGPSVFVQRPLPVEAMRFDGVRSPSFPTLRSWLELNGSSVSVDPSGDRAAFTFNTFTDREVTPAPGCWVVHDHAGRFTALTNTDFLARFIETSERVTVLRKAS